uniref:Sporangia induced 28 kDa inner dynein arm light chain putative n=1 Tax=Albugo laibachii Nc14 TaxID=890382 RepID=F0W7Q0_9STRA|nr:sporangia induced 28 kDa inner dynein arm light chain putative [Albugo laibachii Nc14]|eukprot:CCA17151.1 sporangia induced 28 kDa inner dynein arm light chain putative [Albugo laibachii Nc14]
MPPPQNSLVKYSTPTLVSTTKEVKTKPPTKPIPPQSPVSIRRATHTKAGTPTRSSESPLKKSSKVPSDTTTEDILNSILPPKEWTEDGQLWIQYVSSTPATRLDVINLQDHLDLRLQQRQARETGICPVREELYAQCFDELIRQITINCAERGLLLLRVRDEARMTIAAYQTLYESSIAFGIRKALMAQQKNLENERDISQLESDTRDLHSQIEELATRCEVVVRREEEKKEAEETRHREETDQLRSINDKLKANLESALSTSN